MKDRCEIDAQKGRKTTVTKNTVKCFNNSAQKLFLQFCIHHDNSPSVTACFIFNQMAQLKGGLPNQHGAQEATNPQT